MGNSLFNCGKTIFFPIKKISLEFSEVKPALWKNSHFLSVGKIFLLFHGKPLYKTDAKPNTQMFEF